MVDSVPGYAHNKLAVIDSAVVLTGSLTGRMQPSIATPRT